jgi:hypothetical protein
MRAFAIILAAPAILACGTSLAQTSTVTNCMMSCNSQAANCQTRCFIPNVPGPPPSLSAPGSAPAIGLIFNADANATCRMGCTSTQLSCQNGCALSSPPNSDRTAPARGQLQAPHASMGEPSPHCALGKAGVALAPPPELPLPEPPPPEPTLDAELPAPLPVVVVLCEAPVSLQYVGS